MSELVLYADWPESQYMHGCKHSWDVGETSASVCLKKGGCTCLLNGETLPEDMEDFDREDEEDKKDTVEPFIETLKDIGLKAR